MGKEKEDNYDDIESFDIQLWDRRLQKSDGSGLWFTQLKALLRKDIILLVYIENFYINIITYKIILKGITLIKTY